jgi:C-terminal processing protease CtpA/Prc
VLTIYREAENFIDEITVTRDAVNVPSVRGELLDIEGKSVLYIEIAVIGEDTIMALRNVISQNK